VFTATLSDIITLKNLKRAYAQISKSAVGLDRVSVELFEEDLHASLQEIVDEVTQGRYTPEPLSRIYIPKEGTTQLRPLGIGALKDKVVQKTLAMELSAYFEPLFSDKSYGYRPGKGTLKAVARTKDFLRRGYVYVYRFDIENFFETVAHDRLLSLLHAHIADASIVALIALFLKNGSFERYRYIEHIEGVHQGDPLSPLLANIYLNQLDWHLDNSAVPFVRFADDTVIFARDAKQRQHYVTLAHRFLTTLRLRPNIEKSITAHAFKEGFEFLGIRFEGRDVSIAKEKLDAIIYKQARIVKTVQPFGEMIEKLNAYLAGLGRYYYRIIDETHPQFRLLQDALILALAKRVAIERKRGNLTTKRAFKAAVGDIAFPGVMSATHKRDIVERIVSKGLEQYLAAKKYKKAASKIRSKKRAYAKKFATSSVLYVSEPGTYVGIAKNSITLKQKGKLIYKMPKNLCERIIIASGGVSLSAALVKVCAQNGIAVDFIDPYSHATPYASLYGAKNAYARMSIKQLRILHTPLQLKLAKAFIKGKVKNQINYLKYLNKYHRNLDEPIKAMERILVKMLNTARSPNELMGFEGRSAINYWHALGIVIEDKVRFEGRVTQGAGDVVNAALNYGYAILYSRVQYHLVRAGLSLHISFLHALDDAKPTLVYDLIEEFRAFVVDRTVFTMFNRLEPIKLDKDFRLDASSRKLIAKRVLERIGSYTKHKRASKKIDTIISEQAYMLARAVQGLTRYKPFIGKY
jgi:group II intron reverse transcriptase/maturase/CRISPR-associated endonuclease Cas1